MQLVNVLTSVRAAKVTFCEGASLLVVTLHRGNPQLREVTFYHGAKLEATQGRWGIDYKPEESSSTRAFLVRRACDVLRACIEFASSLDVSLLEGEQNVPDQIDINTGKEAGDARTATVGPESNSKAGVGTTPLAIASAQEAGVKADAAALPAAQTQEGHGQALTTAIPGKGGVI